MLATQQMVSRGISILLCLSVLVGTCLGFNGTVYHVDENGHRTFAMPHLLHAHLHAQGTDHAAHDLSVEAEHSHVHEFLGSANQLAASRKVERRSAWALSDDGLASADDTPVHFAFPLVTAPSIVGVLRQAGQPPGLAARIERTSLRTIVMLV
jgi:hypothetical protein